MLDQGTPAAQGRERTLFCNVEALRVIWIVVPTAKEFAEYWIVAICGEKDVVE